MQVVASYEPELARCAKALLLLLAQPESLTNSDASPAATDEASATISATDMECGNDTT